MNKDQLKNHLWGYTDTEFTLTDNYQVKVTGGRYSISGTLMPNLIPFVAQQLSVDKSIFENKACDFERMDDSSPIDNKLLEKLIAIVGSQQVSFDLEDRLIHSHGQLSVSEVYQFKYQSKTFKTVDFVVYPSTEEQVIDLIQEAKDAHFALIPYGGGTNVSGALIVPDDEKRPVISLDLTKMNQILYLDTENHIAYVQAGIKGIELEKQLNKEGFTMGHEPDSIEFSTLGGWIATNSSGMKRAKYGNIEDLVLEIDVITPNGKLCAKRITPRHSSGISLKSIYFGSEGNLGVITAAHIKISKLPENKLYGSLLFKDFESGVAFLKEIKDTEVLPASIRLVCNAEFRFGQALKGHKSIFRKGIDAIKLFFLQHILKFDTKKLVAAVYLYEGTKEQNDYLNKKLIAASKKYKAFYAGSENGKKGYELTFAIAYLRDFFQQYSIIGETFETSAKWSDCVQICKKVEEAAYALFKSHGLPTTPYLSFRVTQSYANGVCIYFTLAMYIKDVEHPEALYADIESKLRAVIIENGGSISHHHGVGKIRKRYINALYDEPTIKSINILKDKLDPDNIFCAQNGAVKRQ